jgi:ectoine hydroxylase-related dioxygenase (phytanoyl-CoA dioxygenase family)
VNLLACLVCLPRKSSGRTRLLRGSLLQDGGFVVIPGSHRASVNLDAPGSRRMLELESPRPSSAPADPADWSTLVHHDPSRLLGVVHPTMRAGDCLFFMGGATIHGSIRYPQDAPHPRRIFLTNWLSRDVNLRGKSGPADHGGVAAAAARL